MKINSYYQRHKKRQSNLQKLYRDNLKKLGKCSHHPTENVINNTTRCHKCINYVKNKNNKLKKLKKCPNHPKINAASGKVRCQKCIEDAKKNRNNHIVNGKCPCHPNRDVAKDKKSCLECLWEHALIGAHLTNEQATKILEKQNYICTLSGRKLIKGINASPDHIIPVGKHRKDKNHPLNNISNIRFVDIEAQFFRKDFDDKKLKNLVKDIYNYLIKNEDSLN